MADYYFGVNDLKIAPWTSGETYGAAVDVPGVSQFRITLETINRRLEGDDAILRSHARFIAAQVAARFAFNDLNVYEILTGATATTIDVGEYMEIGEDSPPYFGMCAQILSDDDDGDMHIWIPQAKAVSGFQMNAEYGQYVIPEITIDGVKHATFGIARIITHDSVEAISIPPNFTITP